MLPKPSQSSGSPVLVRPAISTNLRLNANAPRDSAYSEGRARKFVSFPMSSSTQRRLRPVTHSPESRPGSSAPSPYLAGEVIADRYRLDREIGRGGMGVVWMAHSLVLSVDVAVKLIHAETAGPGLATRMAREAHAAARLGHPALVRVFDFGWTNRGDPFLVMEFVQGETLASKLRREGPMPAIKAVQTLLPIADGLRLAHERSIVHRDIKPDNILLATDPLGRIQPKLLDFGIAKVGHTPINGKLTQMGAVLGSPEYMSPEQAQGLDEVDGRSDVWSLAIALYELLTNDVPFTGSNYNAMMQSIINDPLEEPSSVDPELWSVLSKGLAKSPDDRWASMSEFGEALAAWLYEHGVKEDLSGNSIRAVWLERPSVTHSIASAVPSSSRALRRPARAMATTVENPKVTSGSGRWRWGVGVAVVAVGVFGVLEMAAGPKLARETQAPNAEPAPPTPASSPVAEQRETSLQRASIAPSAFLHGTNVLDEMQHVNAVPASGAREDQASKATNVADTAVKRSVRPSPKPKKPKHDFGF